MSWKHKPWQALTGMLLLHVLAHIDRNMLLGFSPQITHDLNLSNAQYGVLNGAVWVLSFGFMAVFMGSLADRYSRTRVMAAGILIWSICTAASGLAHSFLDLVLARFFVATGEAALVPAAVSLLADLFPLRRRSTASGIFFMGIPLGIGLAFVIAGSLGAVQGWRTTFETLGAVGCLLVIPLLLLKDERAGTGTQEGGAPFVQQVRLVSLALVECPPLFKAIVGFVLVHFAFAGLAFVQLWLVRERGLDAAGIARQMGALQLAFGTLGAVAGGLISDRLSHRLRGGHASVLAWLVAICAPLMLTYRFAPAGSPLFYIGMCAGFFLPLAAYGPALALIQALTSDRIRSTVTGASMMLINVFAIALGNVFVGAFSDHLTAQGSGNALTVVLVSTDLLVALSLWFFWSAARSGDPRLGVRADGTAFAH